MKLRIANPNEAPKKEQIPWKTIILTAIVTGAASAVGVKLLEYSLEKGKQLNPWRSANPMLPGAIGPHQFQNPFAQMASTQGLPFTPMEAPQPVAPDGPPKWFAEFKASYDAQMKAMQQQLGPRVVEDKDEDAA